MAIQRAWVYSSAVFLTTICSIFADQNVNHMAEVFFMHVLERDYFQEGFPSFQEARGIVTSTPITFSTNLYDHPDRPRWLRFIQRTAYHDGILYGTPTRRDVGQKIIEVTAVNRKTFETTRQNIVINVEEPIDLASPYHVEFYVKNRNVDEVLPLEMQQYFQDKVSTIWGSNHLTMINITSALDRGGRVPLPLPGRKEGLKVPQTNAHSVSCKYGVNVSCLHYRSSYEGNVLSVYIKVGSNTPFPSCLEVEVLRGEQCNEQIGPINCEDAFSPQFIIDWCNIFLIDKSKPDLPEPDVVPGDGTLTDSAEYSPPSDFLEPRDYYLDYVVTITVPLAIALILCLILAYIMCCRREGVEKRDAKTLDIQLVHHHSIQDNTNELRNLAKSRDGLRPLSTYPMFNTRTGERTPPRLPFSSDTSRVPLILDQQEPHSDPYPRTQPKTQQQKDVDSARSPKSL